MKCPGDATHRGIKVIKIKGGENLVTPHFAKAVCTICGVWIKWLSEPDYNYAKSLEPERMDEAAEVQETDVERMKRCLREAGEILAETCGEVRHFELTRALVASQLFKRRE